MSSSSIKAIAQLVDILLILLAANLAYFLRFGEIFVETGYYPPTILLVLYSYFSLLIVGRYEANNSTFGVRHLKDTILALCLSALLTSMTFFLTKSGASFSRIWFVYTISISFISITLFRFTVSRLIHWSIGKRQILIVGSNSTALEAFRHFNSSNSNINCANRVSYNVETHHEHVFHEIKELVNQSTKQPTTVIAEIWFSHDVYSQLEAHRIESAFSDTAVKLVYLAETPIGHNSKSSSFKDVDSFVTIGSDLSKENRLRHLLKSAFDLLFSTCSLIILSPLLVLIAIAIKLSSTGPIIYRQKRHGLHGRTFDIFKFRTMEQTHNKGSYSQAKPNDPRVTSVGKLLRKSSLDELPQLINVVKGEMSMVGPRPHPDEMNESYRKKLQGYMRRHSVKPGITGLAQIRGFRGNTSNDQDMVNRVNSDLEYIEGYSLLLDIKIILKTIWSVISTKNAY